MDAKSCVLFNHKGHKGHEGIKEKKHDSPRNESFERFATDAARPICTESAAPLQRGGFVFGPFGPHFQIRDNSCNPWLSL